MSPGRFVLPCFALLSACDDFSLIAAAARCRADSSRCGPDSGVAFVDGGGTGSCNAVTCPTGCCDGTRCIEFATQTAQGCGLGGVSCLACAVNQSCSFGTCGSVNQCANTWRLVDAGAGEVPLARAYSTMVYDTLQKQALMFGGTSSGGEHANDLWSFKGNTWAPLSASDGGAPGERRYHGAAYDVSRSTMVVFGGETATSPFVTNDLWEWDGTGWTERAPAQKPEARHSHALAYDAVRQAIVLFGGEQADGGYPTDTWEWDGTVWTRKGPATSPPGRTRPAMTFDPVLQRIVMFGGALKGGTNAKDTWLYDGTSWTQRDVELAEGTAHPALSYDPDHSRVVMFGVFQSLTDSTWEWDGSSSWAGCPDTLPPRRYGSAMAYDVDGQRLLLFGGVRDSAANEPTSELYQRAP